MSKLCIRSFFCIVDSFLSFWFASECLCCGTICSGKGTCSQCGELSFVQGPVCDRCGTSYPIALSSCGRCLTESSGYDRVRSTLWFTSTHRKIVKRAKFGGQFELWQLYLKALKHVPRFFPADLVVIPVPLSVPSMLKRGYNQSAILANMFAAYFNCELDEHSLKKVKKTLPQSQLDKKRRKKNLKGVFVWSGKPPPSVLLVDDIFTTGATLAECARTLRSVGVKKVYGWTLFRTPLR